MPHPAAIEPDELLADCEVQRTRGSGPGGQHRNKVSTAVRLTHRPTGVSVVASERRSQAQNHAAAVFRLRVKLALAVRRPVGAGGGAGVPSARWSARVKGGRLAINPGHEDFPALLAEALDVITADGDDVAAAADTLGVSTTQLVKLLRHEPAALEQVNAGRVARGLRALS
jgi:hypothetical protein